MPFSFLWPQNTRRYFLSYFFWNHWEPFLWGGGGQNATKSIISRDITNYISRLKGCFIHLTVICLGGKLSNFLKIHILSNWHENILFSRQFVDI